MGRPRYVLVLVRSIMNARRAVKAGDFFVQVLEILDDKEVRLLSERLSNEPLAKPADTEHPAHKWSWRDVFGVREQVA